MSQPSAEQSRSRGETAPILIRASTTKIASKAPLASSKAESNRAANAADVSRPATAAFTPSPFSRPRRLCPDREVLALPGWGLRALDHAPVVTECQ